MQQPPQMIPTVPSFPPTNITTEQIQKYLDENKKLILAIMENQNLGKLAECAQYQALLQKNLMYLAAIADAQPQASTPAPQMTPHPAMQPPGYFMQHPQAAAAAMQQQPTGVFPPRAPFQFSNMQQPQDPHQQAMLAQTGFRPMGVGQGMHAMHTEAGLGSSGAGSGGMVPGGNKPDGSDAGPAGADGKEGK